MSTGKEYPEDIGYDDAAKLGFQLIEMCDRVAPMDACAPGSRAIWHFDMDDRRFCVTVTLSPRAEQDTAR